MPGKQHARCPSGGYRFPAGSVALGAVLLSALICVRDPVLKPDLALDRKPAR
jgi:hypothetical protein